MKMIKIIFFVLLLTSCTEQIVKLDNSEIISNEYTYGIIYKERVINNNKYGIFYTSGGYTSPFVINLTKDSLEIELLKRQLK